MGKTVFYGRQNWEQERSARGPAVHPPVTAGPPRQTLAPETCRSVGPSQASSASVDETSTPREERMRDRPLTPAPPLSLTMSNAGLDRLLADITRPTPAGSKSRRPRSHLRRDPPATWIPRA